MDDSTSDLSFTADAVISRWHGDNPYFLLIRRYQPITSSEPTRTDIIDLNEFRWATIHKDLMREPGTWMLCSKAQSESKGQAMPILVVQVEEGEQPFYAKRHIGVIGNAGSVETTSYGIGVKRRDGKVDGVFILPNGSICTDDDVYWIADKMNKGQL